MKKNPPDFRKIYKHDPKLADVMTAQHEFTEQLLAKGVERGRAIANPRGPLYVWDAHHRLAEYAKSFAKGDTHALMAAIRVCANHDLPLPDWASRAYIAAFDKVNHYGVDSWDDVFGRPVPKGQHRARLEFEKRYGLTIFLDVLNASKADMPRDEGMFEQIGEKYRDAKNKRIGATRVREIFGKFARLPHFKKLLPPPKPKRGNARRK